MGRKGKEGDVGGFVRRGEGLRMVSGKGKNGISGTARGKEEGNYSSLGRGDPRP